MPSAAEPNPLAPAPDPTVSDTTLPGPAVPNLPGRAFALEAGRRSALGAAFESGGEHYDAVRPGYPDDAVDFMVPAGATDAVDVGAGTGIFTGLLVARGLRTTAVDPSADMLAALRARLPGVPVVQGTAEATGLPEAGADVVVFAQAWHWVDPLAASTEAARLLRPGGTLALVWNQLDVSVPWVHRLARIMHAGDVHRPGFVPPLGPEFAPWESHDTSWEDTVTPEGLVDLAKSRSYYLRAGAGVRSKVEANLRWYLHEHLGHAPGEPIALPYVTHAWRAAKA